MRGVDRIDWELVRNCFHADAYDNHGNYKGNVNGFIDFLEQRLRPLPQSMHFLGQCLIELAAGEVAAVDTYFITAHALTAQPGASRDTAPSQLSSYGRYVDRIERRGGPWRIAHRICVVEANRIHAGKTPVVKPDSVPHHRDREDPVFLLRLNSACKVVGEASMA